jgi:hypothetical protein
VTAIHRVDELRARREARAADRAAFEERRRYGVMTRHAAKLAHLAARAEEAARAKENEETTDNRIPAPEKPSSACPAPVGEPVEVTADEVGRRRGPQPPEETPDVA